MGSTDWILYKSNKFIAKTTSDQFYLHRSLHMYVLLFTHIYVVFLSLYLWLNLFFYICTRHSNLPILWMIFFRGFWWWFWEVWLRGYQVFCLFKKKMFLSLIVEWLFRFGLSSFSNFTYLFNKFHQYTIHLPTPHCYFEPTFAGKIGCNHHHPNFIW